MRKVETEGFVRKALGTTDIRLFCLRVEGYKRGVILETGRSVRGCCLSHGEERNVRAKQMTEWGVG